MKSEKGLTLIELLAGLAILFIISSLLYGVLIGINKNYNQLSSKTHLIQEANILLATLKNYHLKDDFQVDKSYAISYNPETKKAFIGQSISNAIIPLQNNNFSIEKIMINNTELNGKIQISSLKPLNIYIKLLDSKEQVYEIKTIIKRY